MAMTAEQLEQSAILKPDEISSLRDQFSLTDKKASGESLAKLLVKEGYLTKFQAQMAYGGKAKHLIMGSYIVLEKIGAGGMGQVFKARHIRMKREVAIKILAPQFVKDKSTLQRFHREVEAAARLTHQNIVTAFDANEERGTHYLVMEYVRGKDLSNIVSKSAPLPVSEAVNYIWQAAQGLAYAHRQGVVHRDIKPANLLLDENGTIKILDMGLARFVEESNDVEHAEALTGTGVIMGTVDYMSPEQTIDSKTADHRSDIYSLGCTLYLLITGRPLYEGDTLMKRVMAHQSAAIPKLPVDDEQLTNIFEKMVAKKVDERYQSSADVVADLDLWLHQHHADTSLPASSEKSLNQEEGTVDPSVDVLFDSTDNLNSTQETVPHFAKEIKQEPLLPHERREARRQGKKKSKVGINPNAEASGINFLNRKYLAMGGGSLAIILLLGFMIFRPASTNEMNVVVPDFPAEKNIVKNEDKPEEVLSPAKKISPEKQPVIVFNPQELITKTAPAPVESKTPSPQPIEKALPLMALRDKAKPAPETTKPSPPPIASKAGTLAPLEIRMQPRSKDLPKFVTRFRSNAPLGEFAAVAHPARIKDLLSWSIEPILHRGGFRSIAVHENGTIATGGYDSAVRLWNSDWQLIKVLPGHANSICSIAFSPDGKMLASVSSAPNDLLAIWDVASGQLIRYHDVVNWQGGVTWLPDGSKVVHCSQSGVELIDPMTGQRRTGDITSGNSRMVAVSPDGQRLITGGGKVLNAKTLQLIKQLDSGGAVDWSRDGKWIVISNGTTTGIFDTRAFQIRNRFNFSGSVAFSPDSTKLVVGADSHITVIDTADWSVKHSLGGPGNLFDVAWSADSSQIFTPGNRFDAESGKALPALTFSATTGAQVTVNDDGTQVATLASRVGYAHRL